MNVLRISNFRKEWSFWDNLLVSITLFKTFAVLGTLKLLKILDFLCACSDLYAHAEHTGQELMHTLSMCVRTIHITSSCACSAHTSVFLIFKFSFCIHSAWNGCMHWACISGTDSYTEHTQFRTLVRALRICVFFQILFLFEWYFFKILKGAILTRVNPQNSAFFSWCTGKVFTSEKFYFSSCHFRIYFCVLSYAAPGMSIFRMNPGL